MVGGHYLIYLPLTADRSGRGCMVTCNSVYDVGVNLQKRLNYDNKLSNIDFLNCQETYVDMFLPVKHYMQA